MKNLLPFLFGCLAMFLFMRGCESCNTVKISNETDNINQVDSLKIIQQAEAPLKSQIAENEQIIADLAQTIDQLYAKAAQGNKNAAKLAGIIAEQKSKLEKEKAKLQSLTVLLAETKANFQADVTKNEGVGFEVGEGLPLYSTAYDDPDGWFSLTGSLNPNTLKSDYSLSVRNEFVISDFVADDGVAKFRVESKNPYTFAMPGTNTFSVPVTTEKPRQRRFGIGVTLGTFAVKDYFSENVTLGYGGGIGLYYRIL